MRGIVINLQYGDACLTRKGGGTSATAFDNANIFCWTERRRKFERSRFVFIVPNWETETMKKRLILPIFAFLAMVDCTAAELVPEQLPKAERTEQQGISENAPTQGLGGPRGITLGDKRDGQEKSTPNKVSDGWWTRWTRNSSVTDWLIVLFTLALVWLTKQLEGATKATARAADRSADVGEQQIKDSRILQRAYLAVEPLGIEPFGEDAWAHISVRNKGKLPARNVTWFIAHKISDNGKMNVFEIDESRFYGEKFVIPTGAEMKRSQRCKFTAESIRLFRNAPENNRTFLYLWGEVRYTDGFGEERFTKFCHRYDRFGIQEIEDGPRAGQHKLTAESMRPHQYGNDAN